MRKSEEYNTLLTESVLTTLCNKYNFRGHLRDQDLFTLISTENEHLFYTLPEQWNTQVCVWWRDHGYCDVFDLYRRPLNKNSKYFYFMLTATLPFLSMNSKPQTLILPPLPAQFTGNDNALLLLGLVGVTAPLERSQ